LSNGILFFAKTCGDITDILCLRYAGHDKKSAGKRLLANLSKRRPCSGGIAYLKKKMNIIKIAY